MIYLTDGLSFQDGTQVYIVIIWQPGIAIFIWIYFFSASNGRYWSEDGGDMWYFQNCCLSLKARQPSVRAYNKHGWDRGLQYCKWIWSVLKRHMNFKLCTPSIRTVRCRSAAAGWSSQPPQRPPLPLPGARPRQPGDGAQRRRGREHPGHPLQDALLQAVHLRRVQDKRVHQGKQKIVVKRLTIFVYFVGINH